MELNNIRIEGTGNMMTMKYALLPSDEIDDTAFERVKMNAPEGIIPVQVMDISGVRSLFAQFSGGTTLKSYLKMTLDKGAVLGLLKNLIVCMDIGKFGIPVSYIAKKSDFIFVDPQSLKTSCFIIPVKGEVNDPNEVRRFLRSLISRMRFSDSDKDNYVAKILTNLNADKFSLNELNVLISEMQLEMGEAQLGEMPMGGNARVDRMGVIRNRANIAAPQGGYPQFNGQPGFQAQPQFNGQPGFQAQPQFNGQPGFQPQPQFNGQPGFQAQPQFNGQPEFQQQPQFNGQPGFQAQPQFNGQPEFQPQPQFNGQPEFQPQPQFNGQPEFQPQPEMRFDPMTGQPIMNNIEAPTPETPVTEQVPVSEGAPVTEETATAAESAPETPAEEAVPETPAPENPVEEASVTENTAEETPATETPVEETPVQEETSVQEEAPVQEETPVQEEAPATEEPAVEETSEETAPETNAPEETVPEATAPEETPEEETKDSEDTVEEKTEEKIDDKEQEYPEQAVPEEPQGPMGMPGFEGPVPGMPGMPGFQAQPQQPMGMPTPPSMPGFEIPTQIDRTYEEPSQTDIPKFEVPTQEEIFRYNDGVDNVNNMNAQPQPVKRFDPMTGKPIEDNEIPMAQPLNQFSPMGQPVNQFTPMGQPVNQFAPAGQPVNQFGPMGQPAPSENPFAGPVPPANTAAQDAMLPRPHFVREKTGEKIYIDKEEFRIGKSKLHADYAIENNTAISRVHVVIIKRNGVSYLKDNDSTNGTWIDGEKLEPGREVLLKANMKVKFGDEDFTFYLREGV